MKRPAFQLDPRENYLVLVESEQLPDSTYVHACGATVRSYTTTRPIWYPELGPTVGGGEVERITRPYCPSCEELPS